MKSRGREREVQSSSIRAVTFDVGGTLIECFPSVGHIYSEVATRHGHRGIPPDLLNRRFAAAWRAFENFQHTRSQWAALVDATFRKLMAQPPSETFFAEVYDEFARPGAWQVFEDVVPTLEALATRGLKLGIISNWDDRLRPLLRQLRLDHWFQAVVISCEVGAPKPAKGIFDRAAMELSLSPQNILHVGDSLAADVRGARAAGFHAMLLRRESRTARSNEIHTLRQLANRSVKVR